MKTSTILAINLQLLKAIVEIKGCVVTMSDGMPPEKMERVVRCMDEADLAIQEVLAMLKNEVSNG